MDIILQIAYFLAISFGLLIFFYKTKFQYWKNKNVSCLQPTIPYGHFPVVFGGGAFLKTLGDIYKHFRQRGDKHCGLYTFYRPAYLPLDLDIIKNILTKDFQNFVTRGMYYNEKHDPISAHLVAVDGESWRNMRIKLTPTFTSGKMKNMFPIIKECASQMVEAISKLSDQKEPLDSKEIFGCYTTDVIGNCAFGLNCNSFKNSENDFRTFGKKAIQKSLRDSLIRAFTNLFPNFAKKIGVKIVRPEVSQFFTNIVKTTIDYREKNEIRRSDFLQMLIDLKNKEGGITMNQIAANSFVFFTAGFETSSTTMNFALYELSQNEAMQNRARKEIVDVLNRNNNDLTYDSLKEIKYLDQIIDETLRVYSPAPITARRCTKDYKIPNTNTVIEKDTTVLIPIYLIHMDDEYYENPKKFNPDRFSEENKHKIPQYAFIPFGEGPRICIGARFGLMQTKIGLTLLLMNYKFSLNPKTKQPLVFNSRSTTLTTIDPIFVDAERI